ncbi:MAG: hypothetical protein KBT22_01195 [Bacteroidales bacterium]|nr:hypothetical protein [Candidatus Scybalocola fimicaballi]
MVQLKRKVTLKEKHEVTTQETITSETNNQKESSSVASKKSKSWLPFLLCGLLFVGAGIYFLTRSSKEDEKTYASNEVKEEKTEIIKENEVLPVSEDQQVPGVNSTSVVENKDIIKNEVVSSVETKKELSMPDSAIENKVSSSKSSTDASKTESVVRSESIPVSEIERTAKEVIRGKYGNGRIRKDKLGDQYSEIQNKVNEMYRKGL